MFGLKLPSFQRKPAEIDARAVSATWLIRAADKGVLLACFGAILAVYILDAIFFAAWAGEMYLIPVFILIALVIRTMTVSASVVLQWVRGRPEIWAARTVLRTIWIGGAILCLVPAMSFFAGGHKANTQAKDIAAATESVSTTSKDARIKTLNDQIAAIEGRLKTDVDEVNVSIEAILNDGVPGVSASDNESLMKLRGEIKSYRDKADADVADKRAEIRKIEQESETVKTDAAETETKVSQFMAIFVVFDEMFGINADKSSRFVLLAFALFIEAVAAFGLGAYYDIHRIFVKLIRDLQQQAPPTEDTPPESAKPEPWRKGLNSANLNRKANKLDKRIPVGSPEGVAA